MQFIEVKTKADLEQFICQVDALHDSILRECGFLAGGFVNKDGWMYGDTEPGICRMVFQSQNREIPIIVIEVGGVANICIESPSTLELEGDIVGNEITIFFSGRYVGKSFFIKGTSMRYCVLNNSHLGEESRLILNRW